MNRLTKNIVILLLSGGFFISMPSIAEDFHKPRDIRADVDIDLFEDHIGHAIQTGYAWGVQNTIKTIQNYGIIERSICFPSDGSVDFSAAIRALDPAPFPDSNDGGVVYIYTALAAKYPC